MRILKDAVALGGALSVISSPAHAAWNPHRGAKRRMALTIIAGCAVRLGPPVAVRSGLGAGPAAS